MKYTVNLIVGDKVLPFETDSFDLIPGTGMIQFSSKDGTELLPAARCFVHENRGN